MTTKKAQQQMLFELATVYDLQQFRDEELLSMILDMQSSKTTKAHQVLQSFLEENGGLAGLFNLDGNQIEGHEVFDHKTVLRLKAILELARRLTRPKIAEVPITSVHDAARLFKPELQHLDHEELHVMLLDTKHHVMQYSKRYRGTVNSAVLRVSEILQPAIIRNAPRMIIAHCHPSGDPTPSPEDIAATQKLVEAARMFDIEILDHIIIGNPRYTSLKELLRW